MKLYNSLSHKVEDFRPQNPPQVTMYSCGPTVYDRVHIGNLRTYIFEDSLRRVVALNNYKLRHVMNITDVDDKTIKRSLAQYPNEKPLHALRKLTSYFENIFLEDTKKVGIDLSSTHIVRATEHIEDMQQLIRKIPNKYISDDGVYFNIIEYSGYGQLTKLDQRHVHHRIRNDEYDKDHVADFVLWKTKKDAEPSWDFEIEGQNIEGRPGWHIECSAMSTKHLGQPLDIHTGGIDLIFPHHENEIAQSQAATGKKLAHHFTHGGHLLVNGHKMSKSLNNFYTLDDIIKKSHNPLALRLLYLQAHYRSQMNFTWQSLKAAQQNLSNLYAFADLVYQTNKRPPITTNESEQFKSKVEKVLSDDLNMPQALSLINGLIDSVGPTQELLDYLEKLLGLELTNRPDISGEQKSLINEREKARQNSDWKKADELRAKLIEQDIEIKDTPHGPVWQHI